MDLFELTRPEPTHAASPIETAAFHLVRTLVENGIDTFFGIPGGPVMPIVDAILRTPGAQLIESRHETGAALAAMGFHRATGRVPAVVVTSGPGATNAITGVACAHAEGIPLLVLAGDVAATGARLLQDSGPDGIDITQMFAPITRAAFRIVHARSASAQVAAAIEAATHPLRRGPALVVMPIDRGSEKIVPSRITLATHHVVAPPSIADLKETAALIAGAARPLLVLGNGCRARPAQIERLVHALGIPFVTTPQAKGVVSELHPLSLRNIGLAASYWARRYSAPGIDVALVLGTDLDDCATGPIRILAKHGKLVHVDSNARVIGRNVETHLGVVADLNAFAEALSELAVPRAHSDALAEAKSGSPFERADFAEDDGENVRAHRVLADLSTALPNASFVTDIGEHMLFALHYLTARDSEAFTIHLGLGSMTSGICSAIGQAVGRPRRRVVCVCGDGGMQMAGMEVLVAVRRKLPILFCVMNDGRYNMVHHGHQQGYGTEKEWDAPFVDFARWARSFGLRSAVIRHPGEITEARIEELMVDGPALLDIRHDAEVRIAGAGRLEALQQMSAPTVH